MLKMPNLEKQWEESNISYIIKYKAPIASYEYNSFYGSLYESEDDLEKNDLKTWMIINAIKVVNAKICNTKMTVTIMRMKKDIVITPDNILEITECK